MNKEQWQWLLIVLVIVGLMGLGAVAVNQNSQLSQVVQSLNIVASRVQGVTPNAPAATPPTPADDHQVITQKTVNWNDAPVQIAQRCKGTVKLAYVFGDPREPISFCIGENQLVFIDTESRVRILQTQIVSDAKDAPILLEAALVPGSKTGSVLISYPTDTCMTTYSCGAGMPTNYVRWVYNITDQSLRAISNYPDSGYATWNSSGTKAILIPDTCGGAGCDVAPLTGYDLLTDTTKTLTAIKAAGSQSHQAQDVNGTRLQQWGLVTWKNDTDFSATYFPTDKTTKQVTGKF